MITLHTLNWSNYFSYGKNNVIHFDKEPITQLIGANGQGKTSICLILEETLFNKNSKGMKKAAILNRNTKDNFYSSELTFSKDSDFYTVSVHRVGANQKIVLNKNMVDISAHTATATFTLLEEILGFDHKTFAQLVYQNSSTSLEFLSATDTNRKKFLIEFLNLTRYTQAFEVFKALSKALNDDVTKIQTKLNVTTTWLDRNSKENLVEQILEDIPDLGKELFAERADQTLKLTNLESTNSKITKNNQFKTQLEKIPVAAFVHITPIQDASPQVAQIGEANKAIKDATTEINKIQSLDADVCPTCRQAVDKSLLNSLVSVQENIRETYIDILQKATLEVNRIKNDNIKSNSTQTMKDDWEKLHSLIDKNLPNTPIDAEDIKKRIKELDNIISKAEAEFKRISASNNAASTHNSRVSVILSQMAEMQKDLGAYSLELEKVNTDLAIMLVLQKTFSPNGLIAYKIEGLIKDLEDSINQYLADMSGGRFLLTFQIVTGDKLNIVITDEGVDIDITTLSGGERARVNAATLLAIRRMMQDLSDVKINLLILDETIDSLDLDGKEKLIDILLSEEHLNTFLVSHGYSHPLLEKIHVVKTNKISRLE